MDGQNIPNEFFTNFKLHENSNLDQSNE